MIHIFRDMTGFKLHSSPPQQKQSASNFPFDSLSLGLLSYPIDSGIFEMHVKIDGYWSCGFEMLS